MPTFQDGAGTPVAFDRPPRRVVSLVPSLTEALALSLPDGALVGATDWCTHPADLAVPRFGGTKNPDLARIVAAAPDLVVVSEEENKPEHTATLRAAGVPVWVTDIRAVSDALDQLAALLDAVEAPERAWLVDAERAWATAEPVAPGRVIGAVVPIWRRPWMFVGPDTYAGDLLARLGVRNVLGSAPSRSAVHGRASRDPGGVETIDTASRYPRRDLADLPPHELVVLPDEPYRFTADDGPEAFSPTSCALIDGRALTWYGPAMVDAPSLLVPTLRAAVP